MTLCVDVVNIILKVYIEKLRLKTLSLSVKDQ